MTKKSKNEISKPIGAYKDEKFQKITSSEYYRKITEYLDIELK